MAVTDIMNLVDFKDYLYLLKASGNDTDGLIFCFGTSLISRLIQARTKLNSSEVVPSHIALKIGEFLYESTSQPEKVGKKTIPAGVRRYYLSDFFLAESSKQTEYAFLPCKVHKYVAEDYIHYPYGKDIILDYVLRDGSDGSKTGLICSQYGNRVTRLIPEKDVVTPAELYRKAVQISKGKK